MTELSKLCHQWMELKERERVITDARRDIEDKLVGLVEVKPEGTATTKSDDLVIKVTTRLNRRIDADLLQDLAAQNGLTDHLGTLFRWKPDIVMASWKHADPAITQPLLGAITTTEGRPSFSISIK